MAGEIDPALVPLFVPNRHTRDQIKAALAVVAAMDQRQRAHLADAIDGAPLTPPHRAVCSGCSGRPGGVALGRPAPPGEFVNHRPPGRWEASRTGTTSPTPRP
jgi:hypothetical protein